MIVIDETTPSGIPGEPPADPPRRRMGPNGWIVIGLAAGLVATFVILFFLGVGDASAAGGCGGG